VVFAEPGPQFVSFGLEIFDLPLGLAPGLGQRHFDHAGITANAFDLIHHKPFDLARRDGRRRVRLPRGDSISPRFTAGGGLKLNGLKINATHGFRFPSLHGGGRIETYRSGPRPTLLR
jgi:hypothetical protein